MIIEYVWKREIFTDPLLPPGCDVGWCDRASLGGGSLIGRRARYSDGGRGPDWRRCRFTRKVRVRCNLWRLKRGDEKISSRLLYWRRGGGPDWRRCWFIRKVRERCCIWRLKRREKNFVALATGFLGVPHTAPIGGWKSARERPLFQKKNPRDRRKSLLETEMARAQQNHGVKFCFHSGILSRRALENDDCRKRAAKFTAAGSFWKLAIHS